MKIATIITRILMGLMFLMASVVVLFKLAPQPDQQGAVKVFMDGINASGYLMTLIKITELICSLALISGFFAPLATVIIFPITLNILFFHAFMAPNDTAGLITAFLLLAGNLFLAYSYREKYKPMFSVK